LLKPVRLTPYTSGPGAAGGRRKLGLVPDHRLTLPRVTDPDFDAAGIYDADYLHFYAAPGIPEEHAEVVGAERSEADTELIWRLLKLQPGMAVLDLACGHGRIAIRLAARGCEVTGLDSSAVFLDRARADAAAFGVSVDCVSGDIRELPWASRFERIMNWFTAFEYFDDPANRAYSPRPLGQFRWGDQGEVDVFRGEFLRTGSGQQGVGQFLAAAGICEPPRGGINQGQALHRGQPRLTLAKDRHRGQALPAGIVRVPRANRRSDSSPSPSADAASSRVRDKSNSS